MAARRIFDGVEGWLEPLAPRNPRLALAAAGALGRFRNRLSRRWPSPEQVRSLFPHLDARAAAEVAWKIGGLEGRNRLLTACLRGAGPAPIRPLLHTPAEAFAGLRPPLILGTFHVGALHAMGLALERMPGPVLALRQGLLYTPAPPVEMETTEGGGRERTAALHRAALYLKRGGFVFIALDVTPGAGLPVRCLGRSFELARGPFALARLTGAPLVPMVARWRDGGVVAEVGEPLVAQPEAALAAAAAGWLERFLLDSPAETGLGLLRALLRDELPSRGQVLT